MHAQAPLTLQINIIIDYNLITFVRLLMTHFVACEPVKVHVLVPKWYIRYLVL